jgi:ABC-2 type transport system ATP-binding protein
LGIVNPSGGRATVFGRTPDAEVRRQTGYLPEDHRLPEYHTPRTFLTVAGMMYGVPRIERRKRIEELLELVGLADVCKNKIRTFSKGMRQRLGLAHALVPRPRLLLLDEPTDGVDPIGRRQVRDLLLRLKKEGTTILVNSHLLSEVEVTCDRVAILEQGQMLRQGNIEELTRVANVYCFRLQGDPGPVLEDLRRIATVVTPVEGGIETQVAEPADLDRIVDRLRAAGIGIRGLADKTLSLEEVFVKLVEGRRTA